MKVFTPLLTLASRQSSLAMATTLAAAFALATIIASGCMYVNPAKTNPGNKGDFTRAETIVSARRLRDKMFTNARFMEKYAAKRAEKGGGVPVIQLAYFKSDEINVRVPHNDFLRQDLSEAIYESGWFTISGDIDACDFVLYGTYRDFREPNGSRVSHRITIEVKDQRTGELVWTGSDEFAKR